MLKLIGRADASGLAGPVDDDVWRVCLPEDAHPGRGYEDPAGSVACLLRDGQVAPPGYGLYLVAGNDPGMKCGTPRAGSRGLGISGMPGPVLGLGPELSHLNTGDIIYVSVGGSRVGVLWKNSARHNGLLLTEQCDNYCLMCSQPPKDRDDAWLFDRARKVISLLPPGARALRRRHPVSVRRPDHRCDQRPRRYAPSGRGQEHHCGRHLNPAAGPPLSIGSPAGSSSSLPGWKELLKALTWRARQDSTPRPAA
jgi:hypothetical protein